VSSGTTEHSYDLWCDTGSEKWGGRGSSGSGSRSSSGSGGGVSASEANGDCGVLAIDERGAGGRVEGNCTQWRSNRVSIQFRKLVKVQCL
jgi:hypothetical protein